MSMIINDENHEFNSEYKLESFSGFKGLTLESWGPSPRNSDYNKALTCILQRLINLKIPYIRVFLVSKTLIIEFPNINDREIVIDTNFPNKIMLNQGYDSNKIRLLICRKQKELKVDPNSKGGNSTKRILLYNENISEDLWDKIARGKISNDDYANQFNPTNDVELFNKNVEILIESEISPPTGSKNPKKEIRSIQVYERDPKVKAWILKNANGSCECCQKEAPFLKENNIPYLEVHHIKPLYEEGPDTIDNTLAVCPNCHMFFHHSNNRVDFRNEIITRINRLREY